MMGLGIILFETECQSLMPDPGISAEEVRSNM